MDGWLSPSRAIKMSIPRYARPSSSADIDSPDSGPRLWFCFLRSLLPQTICFVSSTNRSCTLPMNHWSVAIARYEYCQPFWNAGTVQNPTLGSLEIATASLVASLNGFGNCFHMSRLCSARLIGIFPWWWRHGWDNDQGVTMKRLCGL